MSGPGARRLLQVGLLAALAVLAFGLVRHASVPASVSPAIAASTPATAPSSSPPLAFAQAEAAARAAPQRVKVAFQLDPSLTQGLYLGQRWVSPPVFDFAQPGAQFVVRAKAQRMDASGERQDVSGDWAAGNPEMVAITRGAGEVTLAIREAGESDLVLLAAGERRVLHVHAEQRPDAMRVRITQQ